MKIRSSSLALLVALKAYAADSDPLHLRAPSDSETGVEVLREFYLSTGGEECWHQNDGWTNETSNPCVDRWFGVDCVDGSVNSLRLETNGLCGQIPSCLANLTYLEIVQLGNNRLTGSLPPALAELTDMIDLRLENNRLTGPLPPALAELTDMTYLRLDNNRLTGVLPKEIAKLTKMSSLRLGQNLFEGSIPSELEKLTFMAELRLDQNQFNGSLPAFLQLSSNGETIQPTMELLNLSCNAFTGTLPSQYGKITSLKSMDLSDNPGLAGSTIPSEWKIDFLDALEVLDLSNTGLVGGLPETWINRDPHATSTFALGNGLIFEPHEQRRGQDGTNLGKAKLRELYLSDNSLNASAGETLSRVSTLGKLAVLDLSNNSLSGVIDKKDMYAVNALGGVLPTFQSLVILQLQRNNITGLPSGWYDIEQHSDSAFLLTIVDISNNALNNSEVDMAWADIGVRTFDLSSNSWETVHTLPDFVEVGDLSDFVEVGARGALVEVIPEKHCACAGIQSVKSGGKNRQQHSTSWRIDPSYYNYSNGCRCDPGYGGTNCDCKMCGVGQYSAQYSKNETRCLDCPGQSYTTAEGMSACTVCKRVSNDDGFTHALMRMGT